MFTGIIEATGNVLSLTPGESNITFALSCPFLHELRIDQSLAHNGVCLTVDGITDRGYTVTAIAETLRRTNLGLLEPGSTVNLERCMPVNGRLDGHLVQGHVDTVGICREIRDLNGSWEFVIGYDAQDKAEYLTVEKGSICVNGVSLTVVKSAPDTFSVHIIPYTYEHTTFKNLRIGDSVNLEFDILGKYVARYAALRKG
jgi:riboflavin synthase